MKVALADVETYFEVCANDQMTNEVQQHNCASVSVIPHCPTIAAPPLPINFLLSFQTQPFYLHQDTNSLSPRTSIECYVMTTERAPVLCFHTVELARY